MNSKLVAILKSLNICESNYTFSGHISKETYIGISNEGGYYGVDRNDALFERYKAMEKDFPKCLEELQKGTTTEKLFGIILKLTSFDDLLEKYLYKQENYFQLYGEYMLVKTQFYNDLLKPRPKI